MKKLFLLSVLAIASTAASAQTFTIGAFASSGGAGSTASGGASVTGTQGSFGTGAAGNASAASNQTASAAQVVGGPNGVMTQTGGQSISTQTNAGFSSGFAAQASNANAGGAFTSGAGGNFGVIGSFIHWTP